MDRLLTTAEVAEMTRLSPETLRYYRWRDRGEGPRGARVGRKVLYKESDVIAWIERHFAADLKSSGR